MMCGNKNIGKSLFAQNFANGCLLFLLGHWRRDEYFSSFGFGTSAYTSVFFETKLQRVRRE